MISDHLAIFINISALTVLGFTIHLLIIRSMARQAYIPLALCLFFVGIILSQPVFEAFFPQFQMYILFLSLPALLTIAPCFWLYVEGLTSETPWQFERKVARHFVLPGIGLAIVALAILLPEGIVTSLLTDGNETAIEGKHPFIRIMIYGALISTFCLVLGWVLQAGYYVYRIFSRLNSYRTHLKDIFSSTETREGKWINWLLFALGGVWAAAAINVVWDNIFHIRIFNHAFMNIIYLIMIWSIGIWGLRQKPGFEEIYEEDSVTLTDEQLSSENEETEKELAEKATKAKYTRSALSDELSAEIAQSIERAMTEDKLYLDNVLSLQKLSKHIHTSPNYVSQTLNETLNISFFDFVNKHRVLDACQRLLTSDDSVVDIAMSVGFNAKSSFYSAFKKEIQLTPLQYRKTNKQKLRT